MKTEFKKIYYDLLIINPNYPRVPKSILTKSESEIIDFMLLEHSLIELMLAIGQNGFFVGEQLLVVKEGDLYKVIEGNRRLASVKLLNNPELATKNKIKIADVILATTERPKEIPCIIFNDEKEIHKYLGFRHITGTKEWRMLEKARYLYELRKSEYNELSESEAAIKIAKSIGSKRDYVERILKGFEIYKIIEDKDFYKIAGLSDTTFYFNYIADSLNKENIKKFIYEPSQDSPDEYIKINEGNLKILIEWFFQKNDQLKSRLIGDSTHLTMLNAVLGNEIAKVEFKDNGLEIRRAYELTEDLGNQFQESIKQSLNYLEQADKVVHRIENFYLDLEDDLKAIRSLTIKIKSAKDSKDEREF